MSDRISIPRISSVQLKSGGAKLHVFNNREAEILAAFLVDDASYIARKHRLGLVGYAVVGWDHKGDISTSVRVRDGRWVGFNETPDFVRSALIAHLSDRSG